MKIIFTAFEAILASSLLFLFTINCTTLSNTKAPSSAKTNTKDTVLDKYDHLVNEKQYSSAMRMLEENDPKNTDPDFVSRKLELAVNFYTLCIDQVVFGFRDLEEGQEIDDVRGAPIPHELSNTFNINKIIPELLTKNPNHGLLNRAWADFRFYGLCNKGKNIAEAKTLYLKVLKQNNMNARAYHNLGFIYLQNQNYSEAKDYFLKALELKPDYAGAHYNLAYLLMEPSEAANAAEHAEKAFHFYKNKQLKSEAALLASIIYAQMSNNAKAIEFAGLAYEFKHENDFYILSQLIDIYLQIKQTKSANTIADEILSLKPDDIEFSDAAINRYYKYNLESEINNYINRNLKLYDKNDIAKANLYFQKAKYANTKGDIQIAKPNFILAKDIFQEHFGDKDPVVELINGWLEQHKL